ncbi:50S ribosomal protein L25/general stress protein Ctc [Bacillaceae bacterium SIJ1]|uniref:50S ribosomal protein L25/general stress protein Ctc n=1 Tax=Litoribacterium kuwaitense TaxID=1398745 RepID=UPI0013ED5A42|nr:50S ribosomal protein L25/general stress protein Ctc [Litoribacterium kuwaitense]NGP45802.1 50S ribosomal protein L25/general stress protein Ctc [Litoribacterium kuwaitense]
MAHTLHAKPRSIGQKSIITTLRNEGFFPAVVYGYNMENTSVAVSYAEFVKTIREAGRTGVLDLAIEDGKNVQVMLHDIELDPLKDQVVHADFIAVDMKADVEVEVPVVLDGEAKGAKEGGVVQHLEHNLLVRAKPADVPESIHIAISELEINDSINVGELTADGNYEILTDPETTILTIQPPSTEDELGEASESTEEASGEESE